MGKASSAKKVARAAASGSRIKAPRQTGLLFPGAMVIVVVLGGLLLWYGKSHRSNTNSVPPLANAQNDPLGRGHWHAAYGFYACGKFLAPITNQNDAVDGVSIGIHTHGDGIIHIHPFTTAASGNNAKMDWFIKSTGITFTDTKLVLPTGSFQNGDTCTINGKKVKATLSAAIWETRSAAKPVIYTSGFKNIHFINNQMLLTFGFMPAGSTLPKPPSEPVLDKLTDVSGSTTSSTVLGPVTTALGTTVLGATTTAGSATTAVGATTTVGSSTNTTIPTATTVAGTTTSKG